MSTTSDNAFDKIRWIAATAVLFSHSFPLVGLPEPMVLDDSLGKLAVMVFFAVSGYLVCQSWDRDPNLLRFTQRRALRIMPGLTVAVVVTALGIGSIVTTEPRSDFLMDRATWDYIASNALLVAGVEKLPGVFEQAPQPGFNGSLWTLRYEVAMYALLAFAALAARVKPACLVLFALGIVSLAWFSYRGTTAFTLPIPGIWKFGLSFDAVRLVKLGTVFFCAASLYTLRDRVRLRRRYALAALIVLSLSSAGPLGTVLLALAVPYITLVVAFKSPPAWRAVSASDLSFGIYVYAYPAQQMVSAFALQHRLGWPLAIGTSLALTLALAALSWKYIEQPALRHKPHRHRTALPA